MQERFVRFLHNYTWSTAVNQLPKATREDWVQSSICLNYGEIVRLSGKLSKESLRP
ncbi:hypothetical protein C7445_11543 [Alicyclobacillus sacchari]|uniref:Uncharacterized protein n=1 Tax=Alicyclobacillus sacchari TaxID=392010 RepID=A0A4R8LJG6_9BACL|nr:hypothetical protein [Alicyclobacillus sacchari]TDY42412.1 hypothetical protein C7445_11543 [Alicyclobacillus sacchari]GMA57355.1 hypothetical protein GCM10025858_18580 [Alicyclobacillus sacchari]